MKPMRNALVMVAAICVAGTAVASELSERLTARGLVEYHAKHYPEALKIFEEAVKADANDAKAAYYRGLTLGRMGNFTAAVTDLLDAANKQPDSDQARLDLGIALVQSGKYEEALPLLEKAKSIPGEEAPASLFLGIANLALDKSDLAKNQFERAATGEASLALTAQYYLGLISYQDREWDAAESHLQNVLSKSPDSEVGHEAAILLQRVRTNAQPVTQVYGDVGFQYDSNVVLAPTNSAVKTGNGISRQADGRGVITVGGRYTPIRRSKVQLTVGYEFYQSLHFKLTEFDLQDHRPSAVLTFNTDYARFGLVGRYDYYFLKTASFMQEAMAEPWVDVPEGAFGTTQVFYRMRRRDYLKKPFSGLVDSINHGAGMRQLVPIGSVGSYITAAYQYDHEDPVNRLGDQFAYDGHEASVGVGVGLPWSVFGDATYTYRYEDYARASAGRRDDEHMATITATRPLTDHIWLRLAYLADFNDSNQNRYEYMRHIISLTATVRF